MAENIREKYSRTRKFDIGWATNTGMVRKHNEDSILALEFRLLDGLGGISADLFAVADGVGGNEGGEIASNIALRILAARLTKSLLLPSSKKNKEGLSHNSISKLLKKGIESANKGVYEDALARNNGMGTTLASVLIIDNSAYVANVGDSRAYLLDNEGLKQITTDHSLVASLVAAGEITPEEIYTHPQRNIITRCLGMQLDVEVDLFNKELKPGNSLLLCSDGLWEMVRDNEMNEIILKAGDSQAACEQLIEAANRNGGFDNISAVIIRANN